MNLISFKFKIRVNKINYLYVLLFFSVASLILVPCIKLFINRKISPQVLLLISVVSAFFYILSFVLIYITITFKFEFKNNVFTFKHPFQKNQRCVLSELEQVDITQFYTDNIHKFMIIFWNKDDNMIMRFYDNGIIAKNKKFKKALELADIPVIIRK